MSFAVNRVQKFAPSPDLPQTATVYDFACLFTHDLKRKAKRWQDGKLKYHTFNKKVMVYDDRGHFVGDAHWDGDEDVVEGDELELDRGGVMVQVADCKGNREQDLTEVLDKRAREVAKRREQAAAKAPRQSAAHTTQPVTAPRRPPPHLPLSGLLQSPGPIGRAAIPDKSPFEARRQVLSHIGEPKETPQKEGAPPSSRKRKLSPSPPSKAGFAQSLFGTRLNLSATPSAELLAARARALRERTNLQQRRLEEDEEQASEPPPKRPAVKASVLKTLSDSTLKAIGAARPLQQAQVVSIDDDFDEAVAVHEEDTSPYFEGEEVAPVTKISKQQHRKEDTQDGSLFVQSPARKPMAAVKKSLFSTTKRPKTQQSSEFEREQHTPIDISSPPHSPQPSSPIVQRSKKSTKQRSPSLMRQKHVEESDHEPVAKRKPKEKARDMETEKEKEKSTAEEQVKSDALKPKGQRTELRIRSRKRRGLLMMTEQLPPPRQKSPELSHAKVRSRQMSPEPIHEPTPESLQPVTIEPNPPAEPPQVEVSSTPAEVATPILQQKLVETQKSRELDLDVAEMTVPSTAPEQETDTETIESSVSEQPPDNEQDVVMAEDSEEEEANGSFEQSPVARPPVVAIASPEAEPESPQDTPPQQRRNLRRKTAKKYTVESDENTSDEDETQDDKVVQIQINDAATSNTSNDTSQGPRLMKMARRSVKSREIFGFVPSFGTASVPMQFAAATAQLGNWDKSKVTADIHVTEQPNEPPEPAGPEKTSAFEKAAESEASVQEVSEKLAEPQPEEPKDDMVPESQEQIASDLPKDKPMEEAAMVPAVAEDAVEAEDEMKEDTPPEKAANKMPAFRPPKLTTQHSGASDVSDSGRPRIINPATRGKKAARKEHAAGQMPQCVVPFEPAMAVLGRIAVKPQVTTNNTTTSLPAALPGFSAASSGAWSRHAEDLLGMTRPTRR